MFRQLRELATRWRARLGMPLLVKELTETAARRRTYVLRVTYALVLYSAFGLILMAHVGRSTRVSPLISYLGYGRRMFDILTGLQLFGIVLFQPALMCGRITQEKERDSLVLLFLTELRPWEIVLQKYVGGLVPMFSFLLLGLPLAGVAYAFGGLESQTLAQDWTGLLLLNLEIGAFALLCSAWCRTTVGALLTTYLLGATLYLGPKLLLGMAIFALPTNSGSAVAALWRSRRPWEVLVPVPSVVDNDWLPASEFLIPSILFTLLFLLLTRFYLVRRAFLPAQNFLLRIFKKIDRFMKRANRFTGNIVILRETGSLPVDNPVYWRETQRHALGKPHYLFRLLCLLEIPTVLLCMWITVADTTSFAGLSVAAAALFVLAILILSTTAANSLVSERLGQTLEVLLTTPLSARQIVRQKERALRRLEWVLAIPLLTVFGSEAYLRSGYGYIAYGRSEASAFAYLVCAVLALAIYLPMITWLSLWIGIQVRTRFQAIITALGSLTVWMLIAPIAIILFAFRSLSSRAGWLLIVSPTTVPFLNEMGGLSGLEGFGGWTSSDATWLAIVLNAVVYGIVALGIRTLLFADTERCLRR